MFWNLFSSLISGQFLFQHHCILFFCFQGHPTVEMHLFISFYFCTGNSADVVISCCPGKSNIKLTLKIKKAYKCDPGCPYTDRFQLPARREGQITLNCPPLDGTEITWLQWIGLMKWAGLNWTTQIKVDRTELQCNRIDLTILGRTSLDWSGVTCMELDDHGLNWMGY